MGKIVISENITLDGVVEDPAGGQHAVRGQGWSVGMIHSSPIMVRWADDHGTA